ncbi:MAG TPA: hypothetical protein EYP56_19240 [Planctomycetaceae bacterium]|nr:hypothetical protein [Planctomycetaceae bacterium]
MSETLRVWVAGAGVLWVGSLVSAAELLPSDWLRRWQSPLAEDRPLQIVHGIPPGRATPEGMRYYLQRGLGGIVCNVAFDDYLRSERQWQTLVAGVEACAQLGMVVWLYDEEGYPSGAAGGLVLAENPAYEATELAYDPTRDNPFIIRPAYEFTHASNNYYAARRYINLIDDRAVRSFIRHTHQAYWRRLRDHFGRTIQAVFTDEPSLIAVNIGQIPEDARRRVPVVDPPDAAVRPLPRVPWCYDLADRYRQRYGESLLPRRRSLFEGDTPEDRRVRHQFWALVAELVAERYFGAIQGWCAEHRIASSGHTLHEESPLHQVPLEGNALKMLRLMDVPGLDMLSSDPQVVTYGAWLTAALPSSAALLNGSRQVMTEVSDFSQKMRGTGPAELDPMQATAAWQAAWGVTEFTLYYRPEDRPPETYRAYCQYVGRLNAILKPARVERDVAVYYPIEDLWEEYRPVAEPLTLRSQSRRAQRLVGSFLRLGRLLVRNQVPFAVIDHEALSEAQVTAAGRLAAASSAFQVLVVPQEVQMPPSAARTVRRFHEAGGKVVADDGSTEGELMAELFKAVQPFCRIEPRSEKVVTGRFRRDGRRILLVVNVDSQPYSGLLMTSPSCRWLALDPATGEIQYAETDADGHVRLVLGTHRAVLLVEEPPRQQRGAGDHH